jgi:superfamily II DNA or RNA helicase
VWKEHPRKPQPSFLGTYVDKWGYGGYKPKTFKNLDDLQEKIQSRAFILDRRGAGGFPEEQTETFLFDLTNPATKHYKEMEEELRTMVQGNRVSAEIVLTQILRLQQITGGFLPVLKPNEDQATNVPLGKDRLMALEELLDQYPLQEPIVIFAKFRYEISAILKVLEKMGRTSNYIVGGMKNGGRDQAIKDFQGSKFSTCVVQVRAGGISVDLSRADNAIFYSASHYLEYEQAKARIIARTGGKKSLIRLAARGTVDIGILEALDTGTSTVEKIMKNPIYK